MREVLFEGTIKGTPLIKFQKADIIDKIVNATSTITAYIIATIRGCTDKTKSVQPLVIRQYWVQCNRMVCQQNCSE